MASTSSVVRAAALRSRTAPAARGITLASAFSTQDQEPSPAAPRQPTQAVSPQQPSDADASAAPRERGRVLVYPGTARTWGPVMTALKVGSATCTAGCLAGSAALLASGAGATTAAALSAPGTWQFAAVEAVIPTVCSLSVAATLLVHQLFRGYIYRMTLDMESGDVHVVTRDVVGRARVAALHTSEIERGSGEEPPLLLQGDAGVGVTAHVQEGAETRKEGLFLEKEALRGMPWLVDALCRRGEGEGRYGMGRVMTLKRGQIVVSEGRTSTPWAALDDKLALTQRELGV
ncbi:unnamed protein product [Pedinophyceae sp. YPF-701]|nr:unnamed protein product [Pedinophyceae sp. YPF-701]